MADDPTAALPPGAGEGAPPDRERPPGWRRWTAAVLVAVPLLAGAAGLKLGCDAGALEGGPCGDQLAPVAAAQADMTVAGGTTTLSVTDAAGGAIATIQEPTSRLPSPFVKFVVVAPDTARLLYVTAANLGMEDSAFWVAPRGGQKTLLKALGNDFWVARPAWCQAGPGDPGTIAYVMKSPVGPTLTGLELWTIRGDGSDDRRVLVGTPENGFGPDLFYGSQPGALRFLAGCARLRYAADDGSERHVVNLTDGAVREPLALPGGQPGAAPAAQGGATDEATAPPPSSAAAKNAAGSPCALKPFAQTDPRWGGLRMQTEGTEIRSWGCALTSTAMVFNYYGLDTDPGRLNACAGDQADLLYWDPVRARCAAPVLPSAARWSGQATWDDLETAVKSGKPAVVGLQGGPAGSHFLVVNAGSGDQAGNYRVVDSWDGSTYKTLADYINPTKGYVLKWLVVFEGQAPPCTPQTAPTTSSLVTLHSPRDGGVYREPQTVRYTLASGDVQVDASHPNGSLIAAEGPQTVTLTLRQGQTISRKRASFLIDRSPPQVTARWEPLSASAIRLSLTATDAYSQVTEAFYQMDGGPWKPVNAVTEESAGLIINPITIDGLTLGPHRLRYYAVDSAGNRSPEAELPLVVAPPDLAVRLDGAPVPLDGLTVAFPLDRDERTLTLENIGQKNLEWSFGAFEGGPWLRLSATTGALAPQQKIDLGLLLGRAQVPPGPQQGKLLFTLRQAGLPDPLMELPIVVSVTGAAPAVAAAPLPNGGLVFLSANTLVVEPGVDSVTITLRTTSTVPVPFTIAGGEDIPWLSFSARSGQLEPGAVASVIAKIDRGLLGNAPAPAIPLRVLSGATTIGDVALAVAPPAGAGPAPPTPTRQPTRPARSCVPVNWALQGLGASVVGRTSALEDHEATLINDDLLSTYWLTPPGQNSGQVLLLDLGAPRTISQINYTASLFGQADAWGMRPALMLVETSTNNVAFTPVEPEPSPGPPPAGPFASIRSTGLSGGVTLSRPRSARYVRLTILANNGASQTGLDEVQVIEACSGSAARPERATPAPTATPALPGSPTPTVTPPLLELPTPTATVTITPTGTGTAGPGPEPPTPTATDTPVVSRGSGERRSTATPARVPPASPTITGIEPATIVAGGPDLVLRILGAGFKNSAGGAAGAAAVSSATVRWNGGERPTTFVSSTELRATIPAADIAGAGTANLTVINPDGTVSAAFSITINNPAPRITSLDGVPAPAGGGPLTLTVNGSSFVTGATVQWNGASRPTTFVSATRLTAALTAADVAAAGSYNVTVVNPGPGGGESNVVTTTIFDQQPFITSLSPASSPAGDPGFNLVITGGNFLSGSTVRWNGQDRPRTFDSASQLTASITAADIATPGTASVTVVNPNGDVSNAVPFQITNPVPVITALAGGGLSDDGGTYFGTAGTPFTLTVTGSKLVANSVIRWDGADRTTTYVNATTLTASLTAADVVAGSHTVTVFNPTPGGGASNTINARLSNPLPAITTLAGGGMSEDGGTYYRPIGGSGFTLTVNGTGFVSTAVVRWNGSNRTTTFVSATQLTAVLTSADLATAGTYPVTVFNPTPGGGLSNAVNVVLTNPLPAITELRDVVLVSTTATVIGAGFVPGSKVYWDGVEKPTTYVSATQLTATLEATSDTYYDGGAHSVKVVNPAPGGGESAAISVPIPWISDTTFNPIATGGYTLRVYGSDFTSSSVVQWDGANKTTTFVNDGYGGHLRVALTAAETRVGDHSFLVVNPAPGNARSNTVTRTIAAPSISSIAPTNRTVNTGSFDLTITGSNFSPESTVRWTRPDGSFTTPTVTSFSPTQITVTITNADYPTTGAYKVTVLNPTVSGGTSPSNEMTFNVYSLVI